MDIEILPIPSLDELCLPYAYQKYPSVGRSMPKGRISKRSVDGLCCPAGKDRVFLWDDALAGFGVAAFASGKKVYVAQFRKDGRSRRSTIGDHGRLTPDEARSQAKTLLGSVEQGADPIDERRRARAVRTFREVAEDFLAQHVDRKRKGRTSAEYRRLLDGYINPAMGSKRIVELTRGDVTKVHARLSNTPNQANRCVAVISAVWNWAARRDEVDFAKNPSRGVERYRETSRERFLTSEEFARLGEALRQAETTGLPWEHEAPQSKHGAKPENRRTFADPYAVAAIRLLIFTGARLREILHARWSEVDFERGMILLPESKTGRKPIYLSAAALAVLAKIPRQPDNPYIIPGRKAGQPRADLNKPWAGLRRVAGLVGVRVHDLRHTFASFGAGASMGLPIIGKLLGHAQPSTTNRYAHLDVDPLRRAADQIGDQIDAAMRNSPGAIVTSLASRQRGSSR